MHLTKRKCAVINLGGAAWAFAEFAERLATAFGVEVIDTDNEVDFAYIVAWDREESPRCRTFVPFEGMRIAVDKRAIAIAFADGSVPSPQTYLVETYEAVQEIIAINVHTRWVLKWPIGCGATGHREISLGDAISDDWPLPYVLQEFIELEVPEVYRLYCVDKRTFGWNKRHFPKGIPPSPWVAHARGAVYDHGGPLSPEAESVAIKALKATHLFNSFGCVDLLHSKKQGWLALEVGTDGLFTHVDRDINISGIAEEIEDRLTTAFDEQCRSL